MPATKRSAPRRRAATRRPAARRAVRPSPPGGARQVWLAGLGAAVASTELAIGFVDALVARGRKEEPQTIATAERLVGELRGNAERLVRRATLESRRAIDGAIRQLGVPDHPRRKNVLHRLGDLAEALL
jgi:hypothetical protein